MILNKEKIKRIREVCQAHHVERLFIFGSATTSMIKESSDVDILVRFGDMDLYYYFDNLLSLKEDLGKIFDRPVDLLEEQAVNNPYLKRSIERNKLLIYGRKDSQMASGY